MKKVSFIFYISHCSKVTVIGAKKKYRFTTLLTKFLLFVKVTYILLNSSQ